MADPGLSHSAKEEDEQARMVRTENVGGTKAVRLIIRPLIGRKVFMHAYNR